MSTIDSSTSVGVTYLHFDVDIYGKIVKTKLAVKVLPKTAYVGNPNSA